MTEYIYPDVIQGLEDPAEMLRLFLPLWTIKDNNTEATSDTTFTDDPELVIENLEAGAIYEIQFYVKFAGDNDGDIKTNWTLPTGATGNRCCLGPGSTAADSAADNIALRMGVHGATTSVTYSATRDSVTSSVWCYEIGIIRMGSVDGEVAFSWAQAASFATATRVTLDSLGQARKLS
jgi:hypothetical protein